MNLDLFLEIMRDDYGQKMTMYDNSRVFTPEKIAKQMVDMLPDLVWDPKTKFLDPCCKTGVFLIEIYNKLDEALLKLPEYNDKSKRRNHILNNQIFGIALDDESLVYSRRNVAGDIFYENIQYLPLFMRYVKNKDYTEIKKLLKLEEVFKMDKFDVVIGNPPYQENTGGGGRNSKGAVVIYNLFMEAALKISDNICFIVKNNWIKSEKLKELRDSLITTGITNIINYPIYGEIFKDAKVSVCIVKVERGYKGETHFVQVENSTIKFEYVKDLKELNFIPDSLMQISILNKVKAGLNNASKHVLGSSAFGIDTNLAIGGGQGRNQIEFSVLKTDTYNVCIHNSFIGNVFCKQLDIPKNEDLVDKYKVYITQQLRNNDKVLYSLGMLAPGCVLLALYPILFCALDKYEAYRYYKYLLTKFYRYLVRCMCENTCRVTASRFSLVPLQDFTSNSDIDWSKSIEDIDKQLYRKYNLTQEEIDYIEKTIKPMK